MCCPYLGLSVSALASASSTPAPLFFVVVGHPCTDDNPGANQTRLDIVDMERSSNSKLLRDYPGHESLWCYRRFICQAFLVIAPRSVLLGTSAPAAALLPDTEAPSTTAIAAADGASLLGAARVEDGLGLENLERRDGGGRGRGRGEDGRDPDPCGERDGSLLTGAAVREIDEPLAAAAAVARDHRYDWAMWSRAATEWHEGCVLEDAKAAAVLDSSEEEEDDEDEEDKEDEEDDVDEEEGPRRGGDKEGGGAAGESEADFEEADGTLPGAPAGGGVLAEFLGREARFALKCATDKVCSWPVVMETLRSGDCQKAGSFARRRSLSDVPNQGCVSARCVSYGAYRGVCRWLWVLDKRITEDLFISAVFGHAT